MKEVLQKLLLVIMVFSLFFTGCVEKQPPLSDADSYFNRGFAYLDENKPEKAIGDFTKAIELNPNEARAYLFRGSIYSAMFENEKAIKDFNKVIEIDSAFALAYEMRAEAYIGRAVEEPSSDEYGSLSPRAEEYIKKAEEDFKKVDELDPSFANLDKHRGLGYFVPETNQFIFPALSSDSRILRGQLIMGVTTMEEVVSLLPPWPGHGPSPFEYKESPEDDGKVREVLVNSKYSYNPMSCDFVLIFDKNQKIIAIDAMLSESKEAQEVVKKFMKQNQLIEIPTNDSFYKTMRGEIMPCTSVDIHIQSENELIFKVTYFNTCLPQ
jgi:tetratricopeptide (TPR) repeat protein